MEALLIAGGIGAVAGSAGTAAATAIKSSTSESEGAAGAMADRLPGVFGTTLKGQHGEEAESQRRQSKQNLARAGYTGLFQGGAMIHDRDVPLSPEHFERYLQHPLIETDPAMREWMQANIKAALELQPGMEIHKEYLSVIDGRGRIIGKETDESNKHQLRGFVLMFRLCVPRVQTGKTIDSPLSSNTKDEVWESINRLGWRYRSVADNFWWRGVDGNFLAKHEFTKEQVKRFFPDSMEVPKPLEIDTILHLIGLYKARIVPTCEVGLLMTAASYQWKQPMQHSLLSSVPDRSKELAFDAVKIHINKMLAFESACQLLSPEIEDDDSRLESSVVQSTDGKHNAAPSDSVNKMESGKNSACDNMPGSSQVPDVQANLESKVKLDRTQLNPEQKVKKDRMQWLRRQFQQKTGFSKLEDLHGEEMTKKQMDSAAVLKNAGYQGFRTAGILTMDRGVPLTSALIDTYINHPVLSADAKLQSWLSEHFSKAVHQGMTVREEFALIDDSLPKDMRGVMVSLSIEVHSAGVQPAICFSQNLPTKDDVFNAISGLGPSFAALANAIWEIGLDGNHLQSIAITDEWLLNNFRQFGLEEAFDRAVVLNKLTALLPPKAKLVDIICSVSHAHYSTKKVNHSSATFDDVKSHMRKMMVWESARQVLAPMKHTIDESFNLKIPLRSTSLNQAENGSHEGSIADLSVLSAPNSVQSECLFGDQFVKVKGGASVRVADLEEGMDVLSLEVEQPGNGLSPA